MKSVMEHSFAQVPRADIPRSSFNRSHGLKTTFDADWLVPILVDEVLPGDTYNVRAHHFARLGSPLLHPIMDNVYLDTFFFFVPNRLLWDNWEKFCGAQDNPDDSIDYTIPVVSSNTAADLTSAGNFNSLADYMGLPHRSSVDMNDFSALPFRAYNLIWNQWFRDQALQDSVTENTDDGPDGGGGHYALLKRGKRHDYFTSALPWPQKGDSVSLPLGTQAPIYVNDDATGPHAGQVTVNLETTGQSVGLDASTATVTLAGTRDGDDLYADLANATAATVNDLRLAFQTQRLLERDARSGTRYNETILAHFGVTVPDYRVQRPEFLGGGSTPINVREVPNTSEDTTNKQAALAAYATSSGSDGFTKSFTEHGIIIGLANVRADITYSQGAERMWFKSTRYDFFYPVLAQIGEQSLLNREIFYQNTTDDDDVFGYQERYAEYRYKPSRLTGLFRPDNAASLDAWHMSEDFSTLPALGDTFIQSNTGTPLDRAIAVPSEPHIIGDFYFDMKCARPMPVYGVPGNLDRF